MQLGAAPSEPKCHVPSAAPLNGGAHEPGQDGRGLGDRVGERAVVFRLELAAGEQLSDSGADDGGDVCQRRRRSVGGKVNYLLAQ